MSTRTGLAQRVGGLRFPAFWSAPHWRPKPGRRRRLLLVVAVVVLVSLTVVVLEDVD